MPASSFCLGVTCQSLASGHGVGGNLRGMKLAPLPNGARAPWWIWVLPIVTLGLLLVSINFAADTVDDVLEPRRA